MYRMSVTDKMEFELVAYRMYFGELPSTVLELLESYSESDSIFRSYTALQDSADIARKVTLLREKT